LTVVGVGKDFVDEELVVIVGLGVVVELDLYVVVVPGIHW